MTKKTEINEIWLGDIWEHDSFTTEWAKVKKRPEPGYSKQYIRADLACNMKYAKGIKSKPIPYIGDET